MRNGMRSKSILTASQFVTPPANPNSPKARMKPADAFRAPSDVRMMRPIISTTAVATLLKSPLFHIVTSQHGGSLWSSHISRPTGLSMSFPPLDSLTSGSCLGSGTSGVFDESVGVGDTLGRAGAGFWSGGAAGAAAPLVGAAPLVVAL